MHDRPEFSMKKRSKIRNIFHNNNHWNHLKWISWTAPNCHSISSIFCNPCKIRRIYFARCKKLNMLLNEWPYKFEFEFQQLVFYLIGFVVFFFLSENQLKLRFMRRLHAKCINLVWPWMLPLRAFCVNGYGTVKFLEHSI